MHLVPFSGPKNDVFRTPKSIKFGSKTRSETKMFVETLLVRFLLRFWTPWGAFWGPKSDAKPRTSRPWAPWTASWCRLGELRAALEPHKGPCGGIGPLPGPHLGPLGSILDPPGSILDPPGLHFGPSKAPLGTLWGFILDFPACRAQNPSFSAISFRP